jgi:hypothetical protein
MSLTDLDIGFLAELISFVRPLPNLKRLTTDFNTAFVDPSQPDLRQLETLGLYFDEEKYLSMETFEKIVRKHCIPALGARNNVHNANTVLRLLIDLGSSTKDPE